LNQNRPAPDKKAVTLSRPARFEKAENMRRILFGALAAAAAAVALAAVLFFVAMRGWSARTVALEVEFMLTDQNNLPLPGVPVRLVFGGEGWQAPDAGLRIVTAADGAARFTAPALLDRRLTFVNIGFTGLSMPVRADHLPVALELAFAVPQKTGGDLVHRWLYTADIDRLPDGDCSSDDLDNVYDVGAGGAFTKLVGRNAAGPNFDGLVDGWRLDAAGYKLTNFMLTAPAGAAASEAWHLKLGLKRMPKPRLAQ
jgi:hypothetical protein